MAEVYVLVNSYRLVPRKSDPKSNEGPYVNINTTFSGLHAKLILSLAEEYQSNKPTALRLFLNQYLAGLLVNLSKDTGKRIDTYLENPIIQKQLAISTRAGFVEYAVNKALNEISNKLTDLRDVNVQMSLNEDEAQIAKNILLLASDESFYGGISLEDLVASVGLSTNYVKRIVDDFIDNGWVSLNDNKYFPTKQVKI